MNSWLKSISDDTFISDINLGGTHNSCAHFVNVRYITQCQSKSLTEQFNMGIRFLDVRLEKDGDTLKIVHAIIDCRKSKWKNDKLLLSDVLAECENFLKENPSEFIVFCVKRDDGENDEATSELFFKEIAKNPDIWYTKNSIPRLSEVRGKIVLFNRFAKNENIEFYNDENWGLNACEWDHSGIVTDSPYSVLNFKRTDGDNNTGTLVLQDKYKLSAKDKWEKAVLPALNGSFSEKDVVLNFFSTASVIRSPRYCAKYIFKKFINLPLKANKKIGWIILDYPTESVVKKIIDTNFR